MINEVIALERLYRLHTDSEKSKNRKIPINAAKQVLKEYVELAEAEKNGPDALKVQLTKRKVNDNGRKMASTANIFKYRLNSGDRILYTYSDNIPYLYDEHPNALVLLQFSKHDFQARDAKNYHLEQEQGYKKVTELAENFGLLDVNIDDLSDDDIEVAYSTLLEVVDPEFAGKSVVYYCTEDQAADPKTKDWEFKLNPEQQKYLQEFTSKKQPMLLLGGAGSGKTVLALHVLGDYVAGKALYLTQSAPLRNKVAQEYYNKYPGIHNVDFLSINDFCINQLSLSKNKVAHFHDFEIFLINNESAFKLQKESGLTSYDIWCEIRGTIKGSLGTKWTRNEPLQQDPYKYVDKLIDEGYLIRPFDDKRITIADTPENLRRLMKEKGLSSLSAEGRSLNKIILYFEHFDTNLQRISLTEYQSMSDEYSSIDAENRECIYELCKLYDDYLGDNGLYDDNDLARKTLGLINDNSTRYDIITIDEIQDYTELQLYLALKLRNSNSVLLAGDVHQLINPTMFRESRIKSLLYNTEGVHAFSMGYLKSNYRCQQQIVDVANVIASLRRRTVGSLTAEGEQLSDSPRGGSKPTRLKYSEKDIIRMIDELIKYPKTAILVQNNEVKDRLINLYGKNKYEAEGHDIIFSVIDVKGMEYRYVCCFDLFSDQYEKWEQISKGKDVTHSNSARLLFNSLYVAVTRAQDYLCFMDHTTISSIEKKLPLKIIDEFNESELYLNQLSDSLQEWIDAGKEFENIGNYSAAIQNYQKGHAPRQVIMRCKGLLQAENKNFEEAVKYLLLADDQENVKYFYRELDDQSNIKFVCDSIYGNGKQSFHIARSLSDVVKDCYKGFKQEDIDIIYERLFSAIDRRIEARLNNQY